MRVYKFSNGDISDILFQLRLIIINKLKYFKNLTVNINLISLD